MLNSFVQTHTISVETADCSRLKCLLWAGPLRPDTVTMWSVCPATVWWCCWHLLIVVCHCLFSAAARLWNSPDTHTLTHIMSQIRQIASCFCPNFFLRWNDQKFLPHLNSFLMSSHWCQTTVCPLSVGVFLPKSRSVCVCVFKSLCLFDWRPCRLFSCH